MQYYELLAGISRIESGLTCETLGFVGGEVGDAVLGFDAM
jgi:hypothetical protein